MSVGENPAAMPWRAATNPAAQNSAAPAPQAMPKTSDAAVADVEKGEPGFLTEFLLANWSPQRHPPPRRMVPL
jgi:hypothetical protein